MRSLRKVLGSAVGMILATIVLSTFAFAQHAAKGDNGVNGQQAAADKQTGKLRQPSAEEAKQLLDGMAPLVNMSTEGLTAIRHENGAVSVDLQDRFQSVAVAKVGADGEVEERCVTSLGEAEEFLASGTESKDSKAAPKPTLEEK